VKSKSSPKYKDIADSFTGRINIAKMYISSKAICRFNTIPIKTPMISFIVLEKNPKTFMEAERKRCKRKSQLEYTE
jgi:hypothetical protein